MKIVVQRVKSSSVLVEGKIISKIGHGLNLLVCMEKGDDISSIQNASKKILALRIFSDENGRMNKNIIDVDGEILAVSQFTLSWNGKKGNRPSFDNSMAPGFHKIVWDGKNASGATMSSGIYIYHLNTPEYSCARKLMLIK